MVKGIKYFLLLFPLIVIFSLILVSADVCCQKLIDGPWCGDAPISECDLNFGTPAPTSCDQTTYCASGTCIDTDTGTCSPNTEQIACTNNGGTWDLTPLDDIPMCQDGCCLIGDLAYFVTQTECRQLSTEYAVSINFRGDLNDEESCYAQSNPSVGGACVFDDLNCNMTTKEDCLSKEGDFNEGFLCTATHLETNCAKTENTRCDENGKVYFLDSCTNLANVYDSSMFTANSLTWTEEMENYWIHIKEPTCGDGSKDCGNCNYIGGTMCKKYQTNAFGMQNPTYGDYTCASLDCLYEGEIKEHGESWCAQTAGANLVILADGDGFMTIESREELANNAEKYNLPGSRYTKLSCADGEVFAEQCSDYRNQYCIEGAFETNPDYTIAHCRENSGKDCSQKISEEECLDINSECNWIPGYRFDKEIKTSNRERNQEIQGSCVPLIPIGFQSRFTGEETEEELLEQSGTNVCWNVSVAEPAIYETSWFSSRNKFSDKGVDEAAHRCIGNCYLIPEFGTEYLVSRMNNIYTGLDAAAFSRNAHISLRKFHYCGKISAGSIAHLPVLGRVVDCAKHEDKRRDFPIFFKNTEWLNSIQKRSVAVGDCGYKPGIYTPLEEIDKELEQIKVGFVKLDQSGEPKDEIILETLYEGNSFIPGVYR